MRLLKLPKAVVHRLGRTWLQAVTRAEALHQEERRHNERPIEYAFLFRQLGRLCPRSVLDVGTGNTALPALLRNCGCHVTASDNVTDYWPLGMFNRHWHVEDDEITCSRLTGGFDMITCISVLEHIQDHASAMREMFRLLTPGGHLALTCPYTEGEYVENVYRLPGARAEYREEPYICRSYARAQLDGWLADSSPTLVEQEFWRIETGRVHALGDWLYPARQVGRDELHQLTCLLFRKEQTSEVPNAKAAQMAGAP
jgi:SAM-dependent methyltransferase